MNGRAGVMALGAVLAAGALFLCLHKGIDARWESCGGGKSSVRSITIADGALVAAVTWMRGGDVWRSLDACKSFEPLHLGVESVWDVAWLPTQHRLCAGTNVGLYCGGSAGPLRGPLTRSSTYYTIEVGEASEAGEAGQRLVAGGYPAIVAGDESSGVVEVERVRFASQGGASSQGRLLVGGDLLRVSTDEGRTFVPLPGAPPRVTKLVARGGRVYAATDEDELFRSDDGGAHWKPVTSPGTQTEALLLPTDDSDVVLAGTHGGIRRGDLMLSRDAGGSWQALGCPGAEVHGVALDGRFLYCGATALLGPKGLWRIPRVAIGL